MATAAKDLADSDGEAKVKDTKETKTKENGRKKGISKGIAIKNRSSAQGKSKKKKKESKRVRDLRDSGNKQKSSFRRSYPIEKKMSLFDKKRNKEFMRHFNESDDDEPHWDDRLRAVKKKFGEISNRKRKEARKIWADVEEARTSSDSNKSDSNESEKEEAHWNSKMRADKSAIIKDGRKYNLINLKDGAERDGSDEDNWFWSPRVENILSATKDIENEDSKHAFDSTGVKVRVGKIRDNDESDDDPWFWDSHGNAPTRRRGASKKDKDGEDRSKPGEQTPLVRKKVSANLKHSIEKVKLAEFKREYYEKLNNPDKSDKSSPKSTSSSSDSTLSSEIEDMIRSPQERKDLAYRFLDDSSDDDEVITYTSKGWTIRRSPAAVEVKEMRKHHWSDESSTTSQSTSLSDTDKSSDSQNDTATD